MNQRPYVFQKYYGWAIDKDGDLVPKDDPNAYILHEEYIYRSYEKDEKKILKEIYINNIIKSLKEVASAEFQLKGWVKGEIHDHCTFVETVSGFFEFCDIYRFLEKDAQNCGLNEEQIEKLRDFSHAFEDYFDKHGAYENPMVIINDPEWHQIRQKAKACLTILGIEKYLDPSKAILKQTLLYRIYKLARPEFQERAWINEQRKIENPFQSLMRDFFEISQARELISSYHIYEITEEQRDKLVQLYSALANYLESVEDQSALQEILNDPKWHQIQKLAQEAIKIFEFNPEF